MSPAEDYDSTDSMPSSVPSDLGDSADLRARQTLLPDWDEVGRSCCPVAQFMKTKCPMSQLARNLL